MRLSLRFTMLALAAAVLVVPFPAHAATAAPAQRNSLVERVGDTGFLQVEASSFSTLSPRQKELVYWLSEASIAIEPIIYDQSSRFGLRQKYVLDLIAAHPDGIAPSTRKKIDQYTKLFWANHGNHQDTTAQKFVPAFTPQELQSAALMALRATPHASMTAEQLRAELVELQPSIFDPAFEPQLTAKNPRGGLDIIQGSSNNFYSGVTLAEVEKLKETHPLNSRVVKQADGTLVEEVYRAGTPDGSIPPGLYARFLGKAIEFLQHARKVAEPGQIEVIDALIRYYQTGDADDWIRFGVLWVQNNPKVDFANGFIEVYRDPRGAKGTSQSFVSITDEKLNQLMQKIAANAQYFENRAPWAEQYKKQGVKPPQAKAIETVIETGDFGVTTVGDNLPNENEIREKYGTKSFLFTGSTRALNAARGSASLREFALAEDARISAKYGAEADDLLTAMHEIIGHGSGKVSPKLTQDPSTYLKEYYSTLEEARADLVALWNIWDPKVKELGLVTDQDGVAKAMYYSAARAPLVQLRSIPKGDSIEEDHQRDRQMIARYIMANVPGAIDESVVKGKHYINVGDFQKMRKGVGMLLAELMRIKGEGDYAAIKSLVDRYGVHFDPAVRDEVVARYRKLDLPTYLHGVSSELNAHYAANGEVTSVSISYPRNVTHQQLAWASMYHPELTTSVTKTVAASKSHK
jgi:dipeptidyl-peptidase-3